MDILLRGGGGKASRAANEVRVERATSETTLSIASASVGVLREPQSWRVGFTMAEILLSLTIIGVVAAITLPSLTGNINERTWNTQRKALYARFSQAIALMPALNGYGTLDDTTDTAAETFITAGLSKVLKINNICDNTHIADCGMTSSLTTLTGNTISMPQTMTELNSAMTSAVATNGVDSAGSTVVIGNYNMLDTKAAAFETQNGESILLFYNPNCVANMGETGHYFVQPKICVNMIYDLNGTKGPNTVGKDIGFMTILYPSDSVVVAPIPFRTILTEVRADEASNACTVKAGDEYRIPTKDELAALFANKSLMAISGGNTHWYSSSKFVRTNDITNWLIVSTFGEYRLPNPGVSHWGVLCVKR